MPFRYQNGIRGRAMLAPTISKGGHLAQWAPPLRFVRLAGAAAAWEPAEEDTRFVTFSRFP